MLTGKTKLLALAGSPVSHSLSPLIQNTFAAAAGLEYAYLAFDITVQTLESFVNAVKTLDIAGFNLTMPLKEHVIKYLGELDGEAELCGSVNTVVNNGGRLCGYNTDCGGFLISLEKLGFKFKGENALVLGVGGAAKAVAASLAGRGTRVIMAARRLDLPPPVHAFVEYCSWNEITEAAHDCNLLVNATPLGMRGGGGDFDGSGGLGFIESLKRDALVYDLIYAPRETMLLNTAKRHGLRTQNGLPMLLYQAAFAFKHFTGVMPEDKTIRELELKIEEINR